MNSTLKNIIISLPISAVAYGVIGFLLAENPIPASRPDFIALAVLFTAIFASALLASIQTSSRPHSSGPGGASDTETGTVKWFNVKKGYGFITRDQGDDVFVHYRNIQGKGRRAISEGQRVQFIVIDGDKGLQADEVETL